jgi:hypothetical protein
MTRSAIASPRGRRTSRSGAKSARCNSAASRPTPSGKFGYIGAGLYVGGLAFPERSPGGRVYLTREADDLWYLDRWDRDAAGAWTPRLLLPASATRLTRPWAVTNPADGLEVVALALERYGETYSGWLSHLVTAGAITPGARRR